MSLSLAEVKPRKLTQVEIERINQQKLTAKIAKIVLAKKARGEARAVQIAQAVRSPLLPLPLLFGFSVSIIPIAFLIIYLALWPHS